MMNHLPANPPFDRYTASPLLFRFLDPSGTAAVGRGSPDPARWPTEGLPILRASLDAVPQSQGRLSGETLVLMGRPGPTDQVQATVPGVGVPSERSTPIPAGPITLPAGILFGSLPMVDSTAGCRCSHSALWAQPGRIQAR